MKLTVSPRLSPTRERGIGGTLARASGSGRNGVVGDTVSAPDLYVATLGAAGSGQSTLADALVQYLMFHHVRPLTAVIVGVLLMGVPYCIARGISNRIRSRYQAAQLKTQSYGQKN